MKDKLLLLYEVQQTDSALELIKREYGALDPAGEEKPTYEAARAAFVAAKAELERTVNDIRDSELERQTVQQKRTTEETKLYGGKVTNPKELQALQDEVAMLERQQDRLIEKLNALNEIRDNQKAEESGARKTALAAKNALEARQKETLARADVLRGQAQVLSEQRKRQITEIPADLLKTYDAIRASRGGVGIAKVVDGKACGGCRMALPTSVIARLKLAQEKVTCDNCTRLLVIVDPVTK